MRVAWALAPLLAALLAGCSGSPGSDGPSGPTPPDVGVDSDSATGAISGVVVDESIRPIGGALVRLVTLAVNVTTDSEGLFAFTDLAPGFYAMIAEAPLHQPAQVTADVVAGETVKVKVQLAADTSPQPYKVTYKHDGFMQVWAGIAQFEVENLGESGACDCRIYFQPEPNVATFVYEAVWEEAGPDPAGLSEYYWILSEPEGEMYEAGYCFSPCHVRLNADSNDYSGKEVMARLDGPDAWVVAQQSFTLFVTLWYNAEAPDDWSFVNGDP